jgi:hypothetical protein
MRTFRITVFWVAGLMVVALLAITLWTGPRRSELSVQFVGPTNTPTGEKAMAFVLSNATSRMVNRASEYDLMFRDQGPYSGRIANLPMNRHLTAGEAETVVIPVPAGTGKWTVRFVHCNKPTRVEEKMYRLLLAVESIGVPSRYRLSTYPTETGWMER